MDDKLTQRAEEIVEIIWKDVPQFMAEIVDMTKHSKFHYNTISTIVRSSEKQDWFFMRYLGKLSAMVRSLPDRNMAACS